MVDSSSTDLKQRLAITKALEGNWSEAVKINEEIIADSPNNKEALNRLGVAYLKIGNLKDAKRVFQTVLDLDPYNAIAKTNLKKANPKYLQNGATLLSNHTFSFIEEPGKSKIIRLNSIGEPSVINQLYTGLTVELSVSARKIKVTLPEKKSAHIGYLPDDISLHLIKLISAGYKYDAKIKSSDLANVEIFIKEIKSSKKLKGTPSFNNSHSLDDIDISSGHGPSQPPLEMYDTSLSENEI